MGLLQQNVSLQCPSAWLTRFEPKPHASVGFVCVPFAGGGATSFRGWSAHVPANVELVALQLPGRETRLREPPLCSMAAVVEQVAPVLQQLDRPLVIFGHSVGAIIAFELARTLQAHDPALVSHLIVSGRGAPEIPVPSRKFALPDHQLRAELASYGGTPSSVLADRELMAALLPGIRADLQINETYRYEPGPRLSCPLTVLAGTLDPIVPREWVASWASHTSGAHEMHWIEGDHFFIREQFADVIPRLRRVLDVRPSSVRLAQAGV